jgi:hypothetical protein
VDEVNMKKMIFQRFLESVKTDENAGLIEATIKIS